MPGGIAKLWKHDGALIKPRVVDPPQIEKWDGAVVSKILHPDLLTVRFGNSRIVSDAIASELIRVT